MIHLVTNPTVVTREDQVIEGAFYVIRGTVKNPDANRNPYLDDSTPLPPQLVQVTSGVLRDHEMGQPYVQVRMWIDLGEMGKHYYPETYLPLWDVNVPENGNNDHHLERVPDRLAEAFGVLDDQNRKADYGEMVGFRKERY